MNEYLWVGTYTDPYFTVPQKGEGIYCLAFDTGTGVLREVSVCHEVNNPSYIVIHPDRPLLFSVEEMGGTDEHPEGLITAFRITGNGDRLEKINSRASNGSAPCHISLDKKGRYVFVANYGSGTIASYAIEADGSLGQVCSRHRHAGRGPTDRQETPHAHHIVVSPDNRFVYSCDLGADRIFAYSLNAETGTLTHLDHEIRTASGAGPRHLTFHPDSPWAYVVCELNGTIEAFAFDGDTGDLRRFQTVFTVPEGASGFPGCSAIHFHPSGRFLYAGNRGDFDSIAVFAVDEGTGFLESRGQYGALGPGPRDFVIDSKGRFLLVGHQNGGTIAIFQIDSAMGSLSPSGIGAEIPVPICLVFGRQR